MAANTLPIYSLTAAVDSVADNHSGLVVGPSANTAQDGSGSNMWQIFQAGANGSYVQKITLRSVGSPAATVARIFVNNNTSGSFTGGTTNSATNTWLISEMSLPAVTLSQTVQSPTFEIVLNVALPALNRLCITFGTSTGSAGTGYSAVAWGGNY